MYAKLFIDCRIFSMIKMQFFKKKEAPRQEEKRFELPELPPLPEIREIKEAIAPPMGASALPSLTPQSFTGRATEEIGLPEIRTQASVIQEVTPEPSYSYPQEARAEFLEEKRPIKLKEPIFVKIDKFKDALNNFEAIKKKLTEIEALLKKVKETRSREQEELDMWEREIMTIKDRVASIDGKLFSKLG